MYLEHFSLKIKPFQITVDPKFLWLGEKHKEALATLRYGILDNRGFLLMTGEVGTGKTLLINRLISLLDMDTVVATLPDPDLESMDFYNMLADGLNMKRIFDSKGEFLIHLRDFLHQSYVKKQQVLLIIDESQRLNHRLMEDIRVLSNIELHDRKLINIFFVGQQEFNSILMTPQNRALSQRITVRYHIEPLNTGEVGEYIRHRLKVAGREKRIFEKSAIDEIYKVSGGIPRLINIVSDHAMLTAYAKGAQLIDGAIINECAEELRIPIQKADAYAASVKTVSDNPVPDAKVLGSVGDNEAAAVMAESGRPDRQTVQGSHQRSPAAWHLAYAIIILLLVGSLALIIGERASDRSPRYAEEDLTPQKYKSTLEKEKARLEDRLSSGTPESEKDTASAIVTAAAKEPGEAPSELKTDTDQNTSDANPETMREETPEVVIPAQEQPRIENTPSDETSPAIPSEEASQPLNPLPLLKSKVTIGFTINSNEINEESYPVLDQIAGYVVDHPKVTLGVKGYTDNSGSSSYNESVSAFRASAVQSYLIGKGVDPKKIAVSAMGSANPLASNNTHAGRKKNRRVEIEFYNQESIEN